ncbi:tRNA 2-thiouridine(34) synthase MnmA [Candidatus Peregrinibacteria bacterium]|jgi:tRNA-uridine 2-sulfurtransferase|nr:tRNA 2-thiouridine(34) synthase MnmA [Candidatus Peregrinibacteria bacterium]MBT4148711.1 tRNA 2-thiouridine(34) synthase MnmA [Candidatus Peregrinibacteria bacterium]MBT4456290.1 tRNA 2-thiouridine(34) synthase MnmA [Candidatus Peregrinibacteria bacterium]
MGSNSASRAKKERVLLAMSGGVDSSLAVLLLLGQGYEVVGVTFKLVDGSRCCDVEAVGHAAEVCRRFGIDHHVIDISKKFDDVVIGYFIGELSLGRTPNPCVICNRFLKFEQMFKFARDFGCSKVATGHYARVRHGKDGSWSLLKGRDRAKDQSYYLSFLKNSWLSKILFPIGGFEKSEIYKMAQKEGLDFLVGKKQSQDLCFVDDKLRRTFIDKRLRPQSGKILSVDGEALGQHEGSHNYTIGQRKGLDISDGQGPYFVVGFDGDDVIVSRDEKDPSLYSNVVNLRNVNLASLADLDSGASISVMAKIRYQQKLSRAKLTISGKSGKLEFSSPVRAVTKGQIAVFYKGEVCLGGGIIK